MRALRQHLGRLAGVVLAMQLCLVAGSSSALAVNLASAACTCPLGDGAICPMHHTVSGSSQQRTCSFRSAASPLSDAVMTLLGPVAVLNSGIRVNTSFPFVSVRLTGSHPLDRRSIPDAPPPRL